MVRQTETFEGLGVNRQNYRESDMFVKILTDRFGKKCFFGTGPVSPVFTLGAGVLHRLLTLIILVKFVNWSILFVCHQKCDSISANF